MYCKQVPPSSRSLAALERLISSSMCTIRASEQLKGDQLRAARLWLPTRIMIPLCTSILGKKRGPDSISRVGNILFFCHELDNHVGEG
jgi:hypothetical protein